MNSGLQNKLSEAVGSNNIAYIINDSSSFSKTGYKVMQNHIGAGLLKCAKLTYNGKIKLVYIVGDLKPLSYVATKMSVNELNAVVFNLIQRALEIKSNGFFRSENLELDFDKIFVDPSDDSVYLIYLPISGSTGKLTGFENEFRIALIKLFNEFPVFKAPQFQRLCSNLTNGSLTLEQVLKKSQDNISGNSFMQNGEEPANVMQSFSQKQVPPANGAGQKSFSGNVNYRGGAADQQYYGYNHSREAVYTPVIQQIPQPVMTITAINSPVQISLTVNMPEYLIGKNPDMVNGALTHNPAISRVHCKISFAGGRYYLTDMGSANGTFVNQQRIEKQQSVELHNGDYIKIANSDFIVSF